MHGASSSSPSDSLFITSLDHRGAGRGGTRVVLSDGSVFFAPDDLVVSEDLHEGRSIDRDGVGRLMDQASTRFAVQTALRLLSRAPQTRGNLRLKLLKRGIEEDVVRKALDRTEELGYLDDAAFAEQWVHQRLAHHPEGKKRLVAALLGKGLDRELVVEVVERLVTGEVEADALARAAARAPAGDPRKRFSRLVRLGFPRDLIRRHVPDADPWAGGDTHQS